MRKKIVSLLFAMSMMLGISGCSVKKDKFKTALEKMQYQYCQSDDFGTVSYDDDSGIKGIYTIISDENEIRETITKEKDDSLLLGLDYNDVKEIGIAGNSNGVLAFEHSNLYIQSVTFKNKQSAEDVFENYYNSVMVAIRDDCSDYMYLGDDDRGDDYYVLCLSGEANERFVLVEYGLYLDGSSVIFLCANAKGYDYSEYKRIEDLVASDVEEFCKYMGLLCPRDML